MSVIKYSLIKIKYTNFNFEFVDYKVGNWIRWHYLNKNIRIPHQTRMIYNVARVDVDVSYINYNNPKRLMFTLHASQKNVSVENFMGHLIN